MSLPALAAGADPAIAVGWFGKLPALGDFASRRLPPEFVEKWDDWLQRSLAASRRRLGDQWLDVYLTSPIWRFALLESACGPQAWAGVIMPSVDRVGRYFPFTLAMAVGDYVSVLRWLCRADAWFDALEAIALESLAEESTVEMLESRLAVLALPAAGPIPLDAVEIARWLRNGTHPLSFIAMRPVAETLADAGMVALTPPDAGRTLWWAKAHGASAFCVLGYDGLPPENEFTSMMSALAQG